jgi:hypothetical protein
VIRKRCLARCILSTAAVLITASSPAAGDPIFTSDVSPATVAYPGDTRVVYSLTIRTGGEDERFTVSAQLPSLNVAGGGAPLHFESLTLAGSGSFTIRRMAHATPGCAPSAPGRYHGYEPVGEALSLSLPANSESVLRATYRAGRFAFWPGIDLRLRFVLEPPLERSAGPATVRLPQSFITSGPIARRRRSGVRIDLVTSPRSSYQATNPIAAIRRGRPIAIRGQLHPAVPNQIVRVAWIGADSRRFVIVGRTRTRRDGSFALAPWQPRRLGTYELWAFVTPTTPSLVSDYRCPRVFRLVR